MGAFANRMQRLATKFLNPRKFGKIEATFTRDLESGINSETLAEYVSNKITYQAFVAPLDIKEIAQIARSLGVSGSDFTINENEKALYVENRGTRPQRGDRVELDGNNWEVLRVEVFETQDTHCAYLLKVGV